MTSQTIAPPPTDAAALPVEPVGCRLALVAGGLCVALLATALLGLLLGTPHLSPAQLYDVLVEGDGSRLARIVVTEVRLPRLVLGLLFGASLALAGTLLQDALRNPLAGPELLGVAAGAALTMAVIVVFRVPVPFMLHPAVALAGGIAGGVLVLLMARGNPDPVRFVLVGAAMSGLLKALVFAVITLGAQYQASLVFVYLLGSNANHTWVDVRLVLPWLAAGIPLALLTARVLNLLQLGDEVAEGLGLPVVKVRLGLLVLGTALVAPVTAVSGPIAWIALLAPHIARRLAGRPDARLTLPLAALTGALLLTAADQLARLAFAPQEVPVGAWTTMLGGPVLLFLLRRQMRRGLR